jgi:hypothetical protein
MLQVMPQGIYRQHNNWHFVRKGNPENRTDYSLIHTVES